MEKKKKNTKQTNNNNQVYLYDNNLLTSPLLVTLYKAYFHISCFLQESKAWGSQERLEIPTKSQILFIFLTLRADRKKKKRKDKKKEKKKQMTATPIHLRQLNP